MPIYTRRGDEGDTSLVGGSRVPKDSPRVEAFGTIDELNSLVGAARAAVDDDLLGEVLHFVQQKLFNCSSRLATPPDAETGSTPVIRAEDVEFLERAVDRFMQQAGELKGFVLEAGGEAATRLHVARAVARRAERRLITLAGSEPVDPQVMRFVNRLSDTLFAAARYTANMDGTGDELWDPNATPPELG